MRDREAEKRSAGETGSRRQVARGHAEQVAEQEVLHTGRRRRRQREQHAEAEQRGDDDRDGRVALDAGHPRGNRDRDGRREHAERAAEHERKADERCDHEARKARVRERLGAVGELVEDDPAAEHAAHDSDQEQLEQRALHEPERPRIEQRVHHSCSWWCAGRTPTGAPSPGSGTTAPP
jgi:hypothetical protein